MKCLINQKNWWWLKIFKDHFDIVPADIYSDCSDRYHPKEHFVFIDNGKAQESINYWRNRGFKVVVEKIWSKFFLMLMNLRKLHRDRLFDATQSYHADSLYSYVDRGYYIKDDVPPTGTPFQTGTSDQRFYNPAWYAQTNFSIVAESRTNGKRFISEKIFKPLAFQHPFIVYGTPNTLTHLHELGFETFNHVIDESYDTINNSLLRLQSIEQVLKDLYNDYKHGLLLFSDSVSQQKILHNHNKFYNVDLLFEKEIINPIKEFINT